ncbi:helix-turn-helix domain-containing protein [Streptomyces sp. NPDC039022]|uniref:helix-turn-helix domain-containing protein n=1 Tax=unclassified Streptomyces TaxID=2593676 RepID=UPI0033CF0FE8
MQQEVLKAFRLALDPRPAQVEVLLRHAGAARWAFNHALGMKVAAHARRQDASKRAGAGPPRKVPPQRSNPLPHPGPHGQRTEKHP